MKANKFALWLILHSAPVLGKDEFLPHLQFACQRDFRAASSSAGFWPGHVIQDLINRTGFDDGNQKTVDTKKN